MNENLTQAREFNFEDNHADDYFDFSLVEQKITKKLEAQNVEPDKIGKIVNYCRNNWETILATGLIIVSREMITNRTPEGWLLAVAADLALTSAYIKNKMWGMIPMMGYFVSQEVRAYISWAL